ncbi:hypothetical protein LTR56_009489 [Elasticomyces elasticus]|nr:hypothetical protein LTR22_021495 [Elasticomyces elasticus]KAK3644824.1 hypothetical protein LTR56_009489 [Elasticomyces elasticus]KAK4930992.1 hypothetical protein LTR49_002407 [Elasticomyces elasticus]KAK5740321.1 hypothetical protein LTS12_024969 [Elasticomyces elasticus]
MAPPSYARPTLSFLLKFNPPKAPLAAQSLVTGSRQESTAFKASLGIETSAARRLLTKKQNCTTCELSLPLAGFPRRPEGSTCKHLSETCQNCWREWLAQQVESKHFDQISCAQCSNVLGQNEIRTLATPAVYERYLDASFKATMSAMPDFRWLSYDYAATGRSSVRKGDRDFGEALPWVFSENYQKRWLQPHDMQHLRLSLLLAMPCRASGDLQTG